MRIPFKQVRTKNGLFFKTGMQSKENYNVAKCGGRKSLTIAKTHNKHEFNVCTNYMVFI